MWSWENWNTDAETTLDLSYEANEQGLIPLECPARLPSSRRTCSTKLFNAQQKRRQGGIAYQRVQCLLCGWGGNEKDLKWRKVGLKRGKSE